jgi:hypothetical protein
MEACFDSAGICELVNNLNLMKQSEQKYTGTKRLFLSENLDINRLLLERERERERERE